MNDNEQYVNMEHVIGELANDMNIQIMNFEALTELGKRAVNVYGLHNSARKITFPELCQYITAFIKTPFGAKQLKELAND